MPHTASHAKPCFSYPKSCDIHYGGRVNIVHGLAKRSDIFRELLSTEACLNLRSAWCFKVTFEVRCIASSLHSSHDF